jgi:hypothetical protein
MFVRQLLGHTKAACMMGGRTMFLAGVARLSSGTSCRIAGMLCQHLCRVLGLAFVSPFGPSLGSSSGLDSQGCLAGFFGRLCSGSLPFLHCMVYGRDSIALWQSKGSQGWRHGLVGEAVWCPRSLYQGCC